jgi:hypothetical protein
MTTAYRAGNGKFVRKDNPVAVIGRLQAKREAELAAQRAAELAARRALASRHGYRGPLTRAELASLVPHQRTGGV